MKRFFLFAGDDYYPAGGASDLRGSFDTVEQAVERVANESHGFDWWQILDTSTGEVVKTNAGNAKWRA